MTEYRIFSSNKRIILSYKPLKKAESILTYKDIVVAAGSREDLARIGKILGAEEIIYDGIILPSFVDAHMHMDSLGLELSTIVLDNVYSFKQLLEVLRKAEPGPSGWIIGRGFDHNLFVDKKTITRKDLDEINPSVPILIIHRSGHMGIMNTKGVVEASDIIKNRKEQLVPETGIILEDALWILTEYLKSSGGIKTLASILDTAQKHLLEHGVTTVGLAGCTTNCYKALEELEISGKLKVRTYAYMYCDQTCDLEDLLRFPVISWRNYKRLKVNGIKILLDGAFGTRTAFLREPYTDDPSTRGMILWNKDTLRKVIENANKLGLQVAVHTIGDAALDVLLEIYKSLGDDVRKLRHRIEHASIVNPDQFAIIENIKPVVVIQPRFIIADKWIVERLGEKRAKYVYPFRSLLSSTNIALSTDAPVEPVNPWETIYAAVTRGIYDNIPLAKITVNESLSLIDALDAYTRGGGYALHDDRLGCLLPGCYSDHIVVDKDPFNVPISKIREIRVLHTYTY